MAASEHFIYDPRFDYLSGKVRRRILLEDFYNEEGFFYVT